MAQTTAFVALAVLLFLVFGEIFYRILIHGESGIRPNWLLRAGLTFLGPLALIVIGNRNVDVIFFLSMIGFLVIYFSFPRAAVCRFVEKRHKTLTSDIPYFDTTKHPIRTTLTVLAAYWGVLVFFLFELA